MMKSKGILRALLCLVLIAVVLSSVAGCGEADGSKISWSSPSQGDEVFGIARLEVKAKSGSSVSEVKFYCDFVDEAHLIGIVANPIDSLYTQVWYTTGVQNGDHVLYSVAFHGNNKSSPASINVNVANRTRTGTIPAGAKKWTPLMDAHPPVLKGLFPNYFDNPVPIGGLITTAGAEDSPFITPDGNNFYFFFTPDMSIPVEKQLLDRVTGIYWSQKVAGTWTEPQRVWLNYYDDPSLDGAETIVGSTMWFASVRAGVEREIDIFTAELVNGVWSNWANLGEPLNVTYQVGELHVSADGNQIYFHSKKTGGQGGTDIWVTTKVNGQWQTPQNVEAVNSQYDDGYPFLSRDGNELWFTRGPVTPNIYRSVKYNGLWQTPELVVSGLAGEPTLDSQGNLYFVHHYYDDIEKKIWEADIYMCRRKPTL